MADHTLGAIINESCDRQEFSHAKKRSIIFNALQLYLISGNVRQEDKKHNRLSIFVLYK